MRDWNMQDRNMRHQIAGVEYAGLENTAPTWNEKSREPVSYTHLTLPTNSEV